MQYYEAKKIIQDVFENSFDKDKFKIFIKNLLKNLEEKPFGKGRAYKGDLIPRGFQNIIAKMERIGKFKDKDGNIIDVLVVELKKENSIEYARTSQRNFIRWYLNGSRGNELKDAALVAFYSSKSQDWRFSLIKMQYSLIKKKDEITPAKRFSFHVGEKGKSHTAQKQLIPLLQNDNQPNLSDLEEAFNIETVSNEFFEKYKTLVFNLKEELDKIVKNDDKIKNEFNQKNIDTLNFAKKLLGQIVFLYFLQKKGWLGLKEGEKYGEGDRNFMRHLFEDAKNKNKNFFNDYLEYLFYDALSKKRTTDFYERFNCRIPFLNGGLFDPINFYDWKNTDIIIPNKLFSDKNDENEEGTGILDIFDLYNFTVKEDEPLEKEVAIDPEMLGKVFERMLEVKERKSKGAFYTPREIVHYMVQQSLLYYLDAELNKKIAKKDLEIFIQYGDQTIERDTAIEKGELKKEKNKYQLPESIRNNAELIDKALENIKICDPAVGSGAFPVGMMTEIVKLRNILTPFITKKDNRTPYFFKTNAIENSIYGVDIDAGAIEIAKLRLWLSLVVDESNINRIDPLPNLEYKIVRGNSLINMPDDTLRDGTLEMEIEKLTKHYYTITDKEEKQNQKQIIDEKIGELLKSASAWAGYKIDFDFKLYFHEVFNKKGGFDVVIGNPPYIQLQKAFDNERKYADLYKKLKFETFERTGDIYALFYEKGLNILHNKGNLVFITSNKWMRAAYGKSLRRFFSKYNPKILIDLGPAVFSSATVDTNILLIQKEETNNINLKALTLKKDKKIEDIKDEDFTVLTNLNEDSWIILSPEEQKIKERIEKVGTSLKDWDISIKYGIRTGLNKAFIIDGKTKDELIAKDPKSAEIIKPILRGRDIKRYKAEFADLWIILVKKDFGEEFIKNYPILFEYLVQFEKELKNRGQVKAGSHHWIEIDNSPTDNYLKEFEKEKIVWQRITHEPTFCLSNPNEFILDSMAFLSNFNIQKGKYILAVLNSKIVKYWVKNNVHQYGTTGYRLSNQYVEQIPIPQLPKSQQKTFEVLVDYILFLKNSPLAGLNTPPFGHPSVRGLNTPPYGHPFTRGEHPNSPLLEGWQAKPDGVFHSNTDSQAKPDGVFKKYKQLPYNPKLKERARALRKQGILSEVLFWQAVKNKQFHGLDFHRQKIIGNYIVDFYCPAIDLVVEIDGSTHDNKGKYDSQRDEYLKSLGLNVIHFKDIDIRNNLDSVLIELEEYVRNTPPYGHPSIRGENTPNPSDRGEFFEEIIDGMVYELYFKEEIKKANCEIIKHLDNLPCITDKMSNKQKEEIVNKVYTELSDKNHPVCKNLKKMKKEVEEVRIIEQSLSK